MAQLSLNCPYCLTALSGFAIKAGYAHNNPNTQIALASCNTCSEGVVVKLYGQLAAHWIAGHTPDAPSVVDVWPRPQAPNVPTYLPENVNRYYVQAQDNLFRQAWDAAGGMFRKALDTSLYRLGSGANGGNLSQRINKLPEISGVTPTMKEWAHQVRLLGNDAMHEEEPFTEEEAKALAAFTEMFLTYAFTLPGMLAERRAPPA